MAYGQHTITLLNGKTLDAKIIATTDSVVLVEIVKKRGKIYPKEISNELVYAIAYDSNHIDTIYRPIPELDLHLTVEEMGHFILGEQDAKKYYKTPITSIIGAGFGAGLGYALHDGFWVAAIPLVYTVGAGLTPIRIKVAPGRSSTITQSAAYQEGYLKVARTKKGFNALLSSVIGTFAGALIGHANN